MQGAVSKHLEIFLLFSVADSSFEPTLPMEQTVISVALHLLEFIEWLRRWVMLVNVP